MCAISKESGETVHMRSLVWAEAAYWLYKHWNLMFRHNFLREVKQLAINYLIMFPFLKYYGTMSYEIALFPLSDINECDEQISGCSQMCTNNVGSFDCSCYSGYTYNSGTNTCIQGRPCLKRRVCKLYIIFLISKTNHLLWVLKRT